MSAQKDKNNVDEFFKNSFNNAELKPEDAIWLGLESEMLKKQAEKDKRRIFFLRFSWAASVILLLSVLFFVFYSMQNKKVLSEKNNDLKEAEKIISKEEKKETIVTDIKDEEHNSVGNKQTDKNVLNENLSSNSLNKSVEITNSTINKQINKTNIQSSTSNKMNSTPVRPTARKEKINNEAINQTHQNNSNASVGLLKNESKKNKEENKKTNPSVPDYALIPIDQKIEENKNNAQVITRLDSIIQPLENANTSSISISDSAAKIKSDTIVKEEEVVQPPVAINQKTDDAGTTLKWWVAGIYSIDYTFQKLTTTQSDNAKTIKNLYEKNAKPAFGYSSGINFGYIINPMWSIGSGILISSKNQEINKIILVDTSSSNIPSNMGFSPASPVITNNLLNVFNSSTSYSNTSKPVTVYKEQSLKTRYKYQYYDIPLFISYSHGKNKLKISASLGVNVSLFRGYQVLVYPSLNGANPSIKTNQSFFKKVYYSALFNVGAEYCFSDKLSFGLAPSFKYGLNSISQNSPVKGYLHSVGLNSSLRYKF